jgi:hypothetical protein
LLCLLSMYDSAVNITSNNVSISIMLIGITLLCITEGSQLCILIFLVTQSYFIMNLSADQIFLHIKTPLILSVPSSIINSRSLIYPAFKLFLLKPLFVDLSRKYQGFHRCKFSRRSPDSTPTFPCYIRSLSTSSIPQPC